MVILAENAKNFLCLPAGHTPPKARLREAGPWAGREEENTHVS